MSDSASQTKGGRMQALAGKNAYDAVQAGQGSTINGKEGQIATGKDAACNPTSRDANAADKSGGINISISLGTSQSQSKTTQTSDTAAGSTVAAGSNVNIRATGAGENSDITVQGSRISAGNDVALTARSNLKNLSSLLQEPTA